VNPARPAPGARLALLIDIPDDGAAAFDFTHGEARWSVLLARCGDEVFAYENRCPHAGYPLERPDGRVVVQEKRYILCSAHGASFDRTTGACAGGPCARGLWPVRVRLEHGAVVMD